ncbi:MAG TPA: hypothetical protein PLU30_17775 [Verrucomicrobiae bacterium]|nr:hypothetical protein [Verrucomicrobiae bacterium]
MLPRGYHSITRATPGQANTVRPLAGILAAIALLVAWAVPLVAAPAPDAGSAPDATALRSAITLAGGYLIRVCDSNGRFEYVRHPDPFVRLKPSYNILRHAGTMYALADYHRWSGDAAALAAIERAAGFMRGRCIRPVEGAEGALAVWSGPGFDGESGVPRAKLGGAGLGLVALASLEALKPASVPRDEMMGVGRFILFLQREDGHFVKGFTPSKGGKDEDWQSLFYPGEAALGLCMLAEIDGDRRWRDAALRGIRYLAISRKGEGNPPPDHWALIATARLLGHHAEGISPEDRALLLSHARQITMAMLNDKDATDANPVLSGAWGLDGRTTPTAIRLEGLLAILDFISQGDEHLRTVILGAVERGVAFLLRTQVREGLLAGGIPKSPPVAGPGADPMAAEIRIDYVQHALSAMLQYARRAGVSAK